MNILQQLYKLPLPVIGTVLICAGIFIPNIHPPMVQNILLGTGAAILAAAGIHISGIGGGTEDGGGAVRV